MIKCQKEVIYFEKTEKNTFREIIHNRPADTSAIPAAFSFSVLPQHIFIRNIFADDRRKPTACDCSRKRRYRPVFQAGVSDCNAGAPLFLVGIVSSVRPQQNKDLTAEKLYSVGGKSPFHRNNN